MSPRQASLVPVAIIERRIYSIRSHRVMLDSDIADLYRVTTKRLNEQVRRNIERFPSDFMFQLTEEEAEILRSQIATSNVGRGGRRYLPYAFTEHGAVMLASVLNSPTAVAASIQIVRAFVRLRELLATNRDLAAKLDAIERKYDGRFRVVFKTIEKLMTPPESPKEPIGFGVTSSPAKKPPHKAYAEGLYSEPFASLGVCRHCVRWKRQGVRDTLRAALL